MSLIGFAGLDMAIGGLILLVVTDSRKLNSLAVAITTLGLALLSYNLWEAM